MKRMWLASLMTLLAVSACTTSPTASTAIDRLRAPAAAHATALAGDDAEAMRATGLPLISGLAAYAGWTQ